MIRLFVLTFFILIHHPVSSHADHGVYCDMADSTAATQSCLKKHLDASQARLNKMYNRAEQSLDDAKKRTELKELQKIWLDYRDAECMWESEQFENPSLKRLNELSCMARVTDDRADILTVIAMDNNDTETVREFSAFPRWMNVIAKSYPKIYWDYGGRMAEDLSCDDEPEQIMTGLSVEEKDDVLTQQVSLAVTQNPAIGKPSPTLFSFNVGEEGEDTLCVADFKVTFEELAEEENAEESSESEKPETCRKALIIKHGNCQQRIVQWDGKNFSLMVLPQPD